MLALSVVSADMQHDRRPKGYTINPVMSDTETSILRDVSVAADWMARALVSSGYRADFSLESLREVDRFLDEQAAGGKPKRGGLLSKDLGNRLFSLGAYVGEVVRRQAGGQWEGDDSDPEAEINVAIRLPDGGIIWPVQRVMKRYENGDEDSVHAYGVILTGSGTPLSLIESEPKKPWWKFW
jgi:hypothetical protein